MTLPSRFVASTACRLFPAVLLCFASQISLAQGLKRHVDPATQPAPGTPDHAASYYHYGLAHLYEDLAVNAGRPDYATQAVEEYKLALNADPDSPVLQNGLADLYFKIGRIREAIAAAKDQISHDPDDLAAHKLLGKVYLRSLGDMQNGQSTEMLQLALTEFETISRLEPNDIETHLLLGQLYGLNHDSAKAEAQFKQAQKIDGNSEEVVLNMARLYSEQGDFQRTVDTLAAVPVGDRSARVEYALAGSYDQIRKPKEAAEAYQRALDLEPGNIDSERGLANALLTQGKLPEALAEFNIILTAEPNDIQSQIHVSQIQRRQGHYDDAMATLKKAKALAKDNLELSFNEALTDDALGHYDDAVAILTGMLDSTAHPDGKYTDGEKSNRAIFLERLGIVYREQNKTTESIAAYKQLIELGGDNVSAGYQGEVETYHDAHQWKEMIAAAADAAKALPSDPATQLMYAGQLADTGKVDQALALANTQLKGTPDDRRVQLALGNIYIRLHRWNDAASQIDKAEALSKDTDDKFSVYFERGVLYDRQKRYDEAEAQFDKALAIDPLNPTVLNYVGYMNADRGVKLQQSLQQIQKALELDPQNYAILDSLGWVYFKMGQYPLASVNLQKAVERSSGDPTVHDHLGEVYERTGKLRQAVMQWERSMTEYTQSLPADADPEDVAKVQHKLEGAKVKLAKLSTSTAK